MIEGCSEGKNAVPMTMRCAIGTLICYLMSVRGITDDLHKSCNLVISSVEGFRQNTAEAFLS